MPLTVLMKTAEKNPTVNGKIKRKIIFQQIKKYDAVRIFRVASYLFAKKYL